MRYLSLDIGDKTIGIAASDLLGLTAQGIKTLQRVSNKEDLRRIGELIAQYEATALIIGYPKNMNGTEGERCELVKKFADKIDKAYPSIEQIFWDERLSTVAAEKSLIEADVSRKKRKKVIDKMAAVYILQGYLDSLNQEENFMGKPNNNEEFFDDEDFIVEMTDDEGRVYRYVEEMVIPIDDENFAILVEIPDEDHEHDEDCDCDEGDVVIAKIVVNEDGEEEYIEPTDEEFDMVQEAYEQIMYESDEEE